MNESEKRRRELLRSAREMYGDSHMPPAVHPRFRNIYGDLIIRIADTPFDRMCIVPGICADGLFSFRDCSGRQ